MSATPRPGARPLRAVAGLLVLAATLLWIGSLRGGGAGQSALAVLSLAAVAAALATGGRVRRLLGVLVAALGVLAVPVALGSGVAPLVLGLVAATALAGAGLLLVLRGHRLPRMGTRYDRDRPTGRATERDPWRELDAGRDPTEL